MKILHISAAFGGGITTSVASFVGNYPNANHVLLANVKEKYTSGITLKGYIRVYNLPSKALAAISQIRKVYKEENPDFVHLHSSYAGCYGRLAGIPRHKLIYSPHGFPHTRSGKVAFLNPVFWVIEKILAPKTGKFGVLSSEELQEAKSLYTKAVAEFIPNAPMVLDVVDTNFTPPTSNIVFNGRLVAQKDPHFLIKALNTISDYERPDGMLWIGGGNDEIQKELNEVNVEVTGWMTPSRVAQTMRNSKLYVHVASYEGFPMSVIEAAHAGLPIIVRRIPAFEGLGLPEEAMVSSHQELAMRLKDFNEGKLDMSPYDAASRFVLENFSAEKQAEALIMLYHN